jgi:hypothetical protein
MANVLRTGVKSLDLKTLMSLFPMVKQVWSSRNIGNEAQALVYFDWHLMAFDSYFNILLTHYIDELTRIPQEDLVILVGPIAREWINAQA